MFRHFPSVDHGSEKQSKREWKGQNRLWYVTEKVDGSQLSFRFDGAKLTFFCRSSERKFDSEGEGSLFFKATRMIHRLSEEKVFDKSLIYHGETIADLRHSTLTYERTPSNFFIVFDIQEADTGRWFNYAEIKAECERMGLEAVPCLYQNDDETVNPAKKCLELVKAIEEGKLKSCLGGTPEGVVLKHPAYRPKSDSDKTVATKLKFVTKNFKERMHQKKPTERISPTDYLDWVGSMFDLPARLHKAQLRLRERAPQNHNPAPNPTPTTKFDEKEATQKPLDPTPPNDTPPGPKIVATQKPLEPKQEAAKEGGKEKDEKEAEKEAGTEKEEKGAGKVGDGLLVKCGAWLAAELDADLLKERRAELEAYIWVHLSRYVKVLKSGNELTGRLADAKDDPVIQRLALLGPAFDQKAVTDQFIPDVCRAARKKILAI